jgi:hypothetical protein
MTLNVLKESVLFQAIENNNSEQVAALLKGHPTLENKLSNHSSRPLFITPFSIHNRITPLQFAAQLEPKQYYCASGFAWRKFFDS